MCPDSKFKNTRLATFEFDESCDLVDLAREVGVLRTKDEAFDSFKSWKTMVESQTGYNLKCLKTDNGLEFCNEALSIFSVNLTTSKDILLFPAPPSKMKYPKLLAFIK